MGLILILATLGFVIWYYFAHNPMGHSKKFMFRRFVNWFPLGMTYAFLYMGRYNLNVTKNALGDLMTKEAFGLIFAAGTVTYGLSFLLNGPLVDKLGGRKGILIAAAGSCLANVAMGVLTYMIMHEKTDINLTLAYATLYSLNMFFQSYGAVSIIKVKAYWFHVRERGVFGAIFGTLISFGVYFAFDWGQAIVNASKATIAEPTAFQRVFMDLFGTGQGGVDAVWLIFFIPAALLVFWFLVDAWLIKDSPAHANFEEFDTHDASSGDENDYTILQLLKKVLSNPVLWLIGLVEFTTGVIRNGILQWYFIFAKEVPQVGAEFVQQNWGLILAMTGIFGGFSAGYISDRFFQSRRAPPVVLAGGIITVLAITMALTLDTHPMVVAICAVSIGFLSISIHSLMSGTAAADFGGRKATGTASGIADGFVYLGTGLQSASLGYLTTKSWTYWPAFLVPFAMLSIFLALKMWRDLPAATKKYIETVERLKISVKGPHESVQIEVKKTTVTDTDS